MKKFVLMAVAALVGLAAVSCEEKEIEPEDALSIAGSTITVGKEAAAPAVSFTANKAWTAESDSQWIVPDKTSGEAGTVTLNISVAENDTWEERSGKVTVAVGSVKTVFTIVQKTESVLETYNEVYAGPDEDDFQIAVKTNMPVNVIVAEDSPWLTAASTKAAPQEGTITIHVSANTGLGPRTGSFVVSAPGFVQGYKLTQYANWDAASSAEAIYIANSQDIYNSETWSINLHQQYVIKLATEYGDDVTLVLNKKGKLNEATNTFEFFPVDKVPAGTYESDAAGVHADNTFSIQSSTGEEKYYTGLVQEGRNVPIYDGEITVAEADGSYTVTAILVDAAGKMHKYSYVGALAMSSDFRAGGSEVNWKNTNATHYTTKANSWAASFYMPRKNAADMGEPAYASFSFYGPAGEVDLNEIPVGTYTFGAEEKDADLKYSNGTVKANPGLLSNVSISLYTAAGSLKSTTVEAESTILTIAKNEDGTKNFKYSATVKPYHYDESYNTVYEDPVQVSIDIDVPLGKATDTYNHPYDDKDDVFTELTGPAGTVYVGYWFSKYIGQADGAPKEAIAGTDCNIFSFGSNSYFNNTWSMMISVIAEAGWTFEKNFSGRYCNTPVPDGTYTFGTEAKIGALIPLRYSSSSRCYVTNTYTGTQYFPVAGSVVLSNGTITVDLTCKATETALAGRPNSPATIHLTGGAPFTCYYLQDWSALTRVKNLNITSPVPLN